MQRVDTEPGDVTTPLDSAWVTVAVAGAVGFAIGMLTAPAQGWLGDGIGSLANSAGPWCLAAVLVARRARTVTIGMVSAAVALAMCEIGYAVATELRGDANATSTVVFWLTAAILAGPPLGVAAVWTNRPSPVLRGTGWGVVAGVLVGEAIYGLVEIGDTTNRVYWSVELAAGVAIAGVAAWRARTLAAVAACAGTLATTAAVVYLAAVSA